MSQINETGRDHYERARKRGQREFAACRARGERGYLPVLDASREQCGVLAFMAQPARAISLNRIAGTYQASRANSFAHNFMPLLPEGTEFAGKWAALCQAHLDTGIRDPIRVYEYLWRYYVAEGNKRVSVLKYFGATAYEAEITRLVPQLDEDDADVCRYYAFLAYARKGAFPDIELSDARKYERLYRLEQRLIAELETAEPPDFNGLYIRFETAYLCCNCSLSLGDAFLEYLHIYGFPMGILPDEIVQRILTLKPQLDILESKPTPHLLSEEEAESAEAPLFSRLFAGARNPRIVFAYAAGRTADNWLGAHERGRLSMQAALDGRVESVCLDGLDRDNAYELLSQNAADAGLLFVTTPSLMNPVLRFALENPDCLTLVYSRTQHHYRLHTYFGRYYEAVFVCGVAAGLYTKTGTVAYVTPQLANTRYTSDINAFAIGVASVRPHARVLLVTRDVLPSDLATCETGLRLAAAMGADAALTHQYPGLSLDELPRDAFSALLALDESGAPSRFLAAPDWNWDSFYTAIVKSYLNGGLNALLRFDRGESPIASFWWGLGSGVIDVRFGAWSEGPSHNLLRYLKGSIAQNLFHPFHGPVYDLDGEMRVAAHGNPPSISVMDMRYLVASIEHIE